ncbi:undecaprenyldiphospho-muramoylpentapeptide beta-N-acetylglucosaminyltransferase [Gynurincola endophyticus]|uniref:undecaprenyldiphospho-muramoylpentapeptide beta-N-acetylglucosaminyltransferase n=1 Tax=Gynurincola endophyticus TaxID=2479004 RepID=UPI000F8D9217|nr:undecaprenyldiphospho-muramoylpentapeptide beta-N-acetylglucosaminyltransferase [Gynurincola endophyticus]
MANQQNKQSAVKRIIVTGGGTGGHIFPAIAIANAIREINADVEILFVGAKGKMEMEKVPQAGYKIEGVDIAGFNRSAIWKNYALPFKLIKSYFQVKKIFKEFQPDAVIGVGGYASFPVVQYAQSKKIKSFIHESNSFAGKSNIILGKKATTVYVASKGMEKFFPAEKIKVTGNPVRKNIKTGLVDRAQALEFFDLSADKKTVFVTGGSLGAKTINEAIADQIDLFKKEDVQLIWQTGKLFAATAAAYAVDNKNIWVNSFISNMEMAYAAADIVVSRAGAMACAELAVMGKPVIFVPYPHAAEDHQTKNAQNYVEQQAAQMIPDYLAKEFLVPKVIELLKDEAARAMMKQNIKTLAITDADQEIARDILDKI